MKHPAASYGVSFCAMSLKDIYNCLYSVFCLPWFFTYSLITVSFWFLPTVATKWPSVQNCPPHIFSLPLGILKKFGLQLYFLLFLLFDLENNLEYFVLKNAHVLYLFLSPKTLCNHILVLFQDKFVSDVHLLFHQKQHGGIFLDILYGKQDYLHYGINKYICFLPWHRPHYILHTTFGFTLQAAGKCPRV